MVAWKQKEQSSPVREKCSEGGTERWGSYTVLVLMEGIRNEQSVFLSLGWHRCSPASVSPLSLYPSISPPSLLFTYCSLSLCPLCLCYRAYLELLGRLAKQVSLAGRCSEKKQKKNNNKIRYIHWSSYSLCSCTKRFVVLVITFTATEAAEYTLQFALGGFSCLTFSLRVN